MAKRINYARIRNKKLLNKYAKEDAKRTLALREYFKDKPDGIK